MTSFQSCSIVCVAERDPGHADCVPGVFSVSGAPVDQLRVQSDEQLRAGAGHQGRVRHLPHPRGRAVRPLHHRKVRLGSRENEGEGLWLREKEGEGLWLREKEGEGLWLREKEGEGLWLREKEGEGLWSREKEGEGLWSREKEGEGLWSRD